MAENRIKKSDIAEDDLFGAIGASALKNLDSLDKFDKQLTEIATKLKVVFQKGGKGDLQGINNLVNASNNLNTVTKKVIETEKQRTVATKALTVEQQKQREATRQANVESKQVARLKLAEKGSIEALRAQLAIVTTAWTKLTKEEVENTKRGQRLNESKRKLTEELKRLEAATGDNRRNVGNYTSALDGLQGKFRSLLGVASQFGIALGGVAIIRNGINVIKDFDQGIANLASVLGVSRGEMVKLEEDAKRLGATTRFTASEVANLQTEFAKLGFSQKEILAATGATLDLAAATGADLARAAEVAGSTVRAFGLNANETQRIVDVMAKSFSTSALDMESFAEAMKFVAPVSKAAGLSVEETTAMLGSLANAGIKGSQAGTALRQVISELDKTGKTTSEAMQDLATKGLNLADAEDEVGKNAKTALLVLADQTKQTAELAAQYDNAEGAAAQMAKTQSETLGGAVARLTSAWEGFILKMNDASGAGKGLTAAIDFLANNLETILKVVFQAIKFWGLYKIVTSDVTKNIITFGKELFKAKGNLLQANRAMNEGGKSAKAFGGALKGIGITAIVAVVIELAQAFFDVATGADIAARKMSAFEATTKAIEMRNNKIISQAESQVEAERQRLQVLVASGKLSDEQAVKEFKAFLLRKEFVGEEIDFETRKAKVIEQNIFDRLRAENKVRDEDIKRKKAEIRILEQEGEFKNRLRIGGLKGEVQALSESKAAVNEYILALKGELFNTNLSILSNEQNAKAQKKTNNEKEKTVSLLREIEDEQIKRIKDEEIRAQVEATTEAKRRTEDIQKTKANEEEKARLIKEININLNIELARIAEEAAKERRQIFENEFVDIDAPDIIAEEDEKISKSFKRRRLELLKSSKESKELQKEITQDEIDELEKRIEFREVIGQDTLDLELELADKKRALRDKELEDEKKHRDELAELLQRSGEEILNGFIERSKKREDLLQSEIDQSQALEDALREQAQQGNAIATESLAKQQQITAEKERLRRQEQQKQQALEEAKIIMQSIQNFMQQGDSLPSATAKSVALTTGIRKIIESIPGFFKGTKGKLGDEMSATRQGRDGHLIWADKDEMILNPTKVNDLEKAGIHTTDDVVRNAILYKGMSSDNTSISQNISVDFSTVVSEIKELKQVIKEKPEYSLHPDLKMGILNGLIEIEKRGNKVTRTRLRP